MKKIKDKYGQNILVGTAKEVKAVYKAITRAYCRYATEWHGSHCDSPILVEDRGYGLIFDEEERVMYVKPVSMYFVNCVF